MTTASRLSAAVVSFRASLVAMLVCVAPAVAQPGVDNIGHERHLHRHNPKHDTTVDASRFHTSRESPVTLPLPEEKDAFFFVVFGDRTGGPASGVSVLADAVRDVNLLEPDLVMTVGDLINGYNQTPDWMWQMEEYQRIMGELICPWFPVAGNHDTYWRGPEGQKPEGEHDRNYEMHFGPLWYAFEHKNSWFIVLYTDEGNPETGEKNFGKPECQRMSPEQFGWLQETLGKAEDADHVFVFVHHPRWLKGRYGDDWDKVHEALVEAGNVSAVFAGHIHQMRADPKDGIEYITLATVGGGQSEKVPEAGWLHHFNIVTVRKDQVAHAAVPVGEVMDVREITGELHMQAGILADLHPKIDGRIRLENDGAAEGSIEVTVHNPSGLPIDVSITPHSADSRWFFGPDHTHGVIDAGGARTYQFRVEHLGDSLDKAFRMADVVVAKEMLAPGHRYAIPETRTQIPMEIDLHAPARPVAEMAMRFDGEDDVLRVESTAVEAPDGPLTLECWFNAEAFTNRTGLVCKTESSEYGFFVSNGTPGYYIHVGGSYVNLEGPAGSLETGRWYHIAGVYDGAEARLYLDGELIAREARSGSRRVNALPLLVGADVDGRGRPMSHFQGMIDGVRVSSVARYEGEGFTPRRRPGSDEDTLLLLNMDGIVGPWVFDESGAKAHPVLTGDPEVVPAR